MKKKVAVVGGGAAGMMAAVQAAENGAFVDLYERNDRVGKKLLATGNGRCNFSNTDMGRHAYYGSAVSFYEKLFSRFGVPETIDFFGQSGMLIKDKKGYLYPLSEQAATVLDVLRYRVERCNVRVHTESMVQAVHRDSKSGMFSVLCGENAAGNNALYDAAILACGGVAAPKTGSDGSGYKLAKALGHHVTEVVPALVQLRCREDFFKSVAGVRVEAGLTLLVDGQIKRRTQGELQLTDYGISGIPVFQFSREAAYAVLHKRKVTVLIDFLPDFDKKGPKGYAAFWKERWTRQAHQTLEQFLTGISNKKINQLVIRLAGCRPLEQVKTLSAQKRNKIADLYRNLSVSVQAPNSFEQAQVSAGGIPADELTEELESKYVPQLYFAGELIDMDGICGGYNLQWAWTSGAIAGRAAAGKL